MIKLTSKEVRIADRITALKREAGSHSPGILTLVEAIPELKVDIDACFLSNPYATEVFLDELRSEISSQDQLRRLVELYPSQNSVLARALSGPLDIDPSMLFVGNGATEIIQTLIHDSSIRKIVVNIPTFSPYYEFARNGTEVVFYQLSKENQFKLDPDHYADFIQKHRPDAVVLINPNNPDGSFLSREELSALLDRLSHVPLVIVDESFLHFAVEDRIAELIALHRLPLKYSNVITVKSMSKDFGIAGLRVGYAVMPPSKRDMLLKNGFLWNTNAFAELFIRMYARPDFQSKYAAARVRYLEDREEFFAELSRLPGIKAYPSQANFALLELTDGSKASDFVARLLIRNGIYSRTCEDKIGLNGEFIRLAVRSRTENLQIIRALRTIHENQE